MAGRDRWTPIPTSGRPSGPSLPSALDHVIRQFIRVRARLREIACQHFPDFANGFHQRITKLLVPEMRADSFHDTLPEFVAAFLVNRFIANDGKLMSTRRDINEHRIALTGLVHTETMELLLCRDEWITIQLSPLD